MTYKITFHTSVHDENGEETPTLNVPRASAMNEDHIESALNNQQKEELVSRITRYMIARNTNKRPVLKAELSKIVFADIEISSNKKNVTFCAALSASQTKLRNTFGMEIIEVARKVRRHSHTTTTAHRRISVSSTQPISVVKAYILVSILPSEYRPSCPTESIKKALLTVVASFITLAPGCRISQPQLYHELARIGIDVDVHKAPEEMTCSSMREWLEGEVVKQWYLERETEGETYYYGLGGRLRAEIDDRDLIDFIDEVFQTQDGCDAGLDETARLELQTRLNDTAIAVIDRID